MVTSGRRAAGGTRRGERSRPRLTRAAGLRLVGAVLALAGWAALVWIAIGFGRSARGGDTAAWAWLAISSIGAVGCLFGCLLLTTMALRHRGAVPRSAPRH